MVRLFYSEYGIENIARRVLTAYDARLYYGQPSAIPIEDLIEANGLSLEYQYLRKNGRILGKTIFDDGLEAVYDMERHEYTLFPVRAGTILVDASLCEEDASTGRFRFTCAHELAHWCLHKKLYLGTGEGDRYGIPGKSIGLRDPHASGAGQAVLLSAAFRPDLQADRCGGGGVVSGVQASYEHPTAGT